MRARQVGVVLKRIAGPAIARKAKEILVVTVHGTDGQATSPKTARDSVRGCIEALDKNRCADISISDLVIWFQAKSFLVDVLQNERCGA